MCSRRCLLTCLALLCLIGYLLGLQVARGATGRAYLDPKVVRALRTGLIGLGARGAARVQPGTAPVLVTLAAPATQQLLDQLAGAGVKLDTSTSLPLYYRHLVPGQIDQAALGRLLRLPQVLRVDLLPGRGPPPLDRSAQLVGLSGGRGARSASVMDQLTGAGVTIADLDTNADVFHPQFFRADGGYYDWIDVDGDGAFRPGSDAIDLDRDGKQGAGEIAVLLRAATTEGFTGEEVPARSPGFDPAVDWLYLDDNGNRRRDFGADGGFDDTALALGEPLFVPDDLDRSGKLDVGERVVRLGTSKFRKVYVRIESPARLTRIFARGENLSQLKVDYSHGQLYGYADALHGSGVLSIAAGDVPLVGRRWVGMAPEADLLLGWEAARGESLPVMAATWALREKADVMLYELAPWTGVALDGSDPLSALIDASADSDQVVHTCPVGNIGGASKHLRVPVPAGADRSLPLEVPAQVFGRRPGYVEVSLNVREQAEVKVRLREPGGQTHDVMSQVQVDLSTGAHLYPTLEMTPRGTYLVDLILYTEDSMAAPLPDGLFTVLVTGHGGRDVVVEAYVADDISGFAPGVAWQGGDDQRTLAVPSVADHCVAVGAHTGHPADDPWFYGDEGAGEVRVYSASGPRIDGLLKLDVVAPDNPWAAAPSGEVFGFGEGEVPHGAVAPFGGTSGAGPHVSGVAALLVQAGVRGDAVGQALREGAVADEDTGVVPNPRAGHGRLSALRSLMGRTGTPPTLKVTADRARPGAPTLLRPEATDAEGGPLEVRWDDDYDGSWDTPYGPLGERQVVRREGPQPYRARVRDSEGLVAEAVVWLADAEEVPEVLDSMGCGCRAGGAAPAGGGLLLCIGLLLLVLLQRRPSGSRKR